MTKIREILPEMTRLRDEVRVRLHLLSLEAQEQWRSLEASLENLEHRLGQGGEELARTAGERAHSVVGAWREFLTGQFGPSSAARSIMTINVLTCLPSDSLNQAARIFWERNCGAAPVVDVEGRLVGMLTDRDVCIAAYTQGRRLTDIDVESVMSKSVHAASPDDSIERVLEIMRTAKVHRVPIVDENQRVVGIVAIADVVRWVDRLPAEQSAIGSALLDAVRAISAGPAYTDRQAAAE